MWTDKVSKKKKIKNRKTQKWIQSRLLATLAKITLCTNLAKPEKVSLPSGNKNPNLKSLT